MKISARNVLAGKVEKVTKGAVNAEVELTLSGGEKIASIITNASVDALQLSEGTSACAVIKASEVLIGVEIEGARLRARNILPGVVAHVEDGAVNSEVTLTLAGGTKVVASITKASVQALGLKTGSSAAAIVKASSVMIGV